jgi:release factor glutamine methyltransferase
MELENKLFYWNGLEFDRTNPNIYPPKPASLLLAETTIKVVKPENKVLNACSGSGVVAISIAKFVPNVTVFVSDFNPDAVAATRLNAEKNSVEITAVVGDLYEQFPEDEFDVITVHPPAVPYPPQRDWGMTTGMRFATFGGEDGSLLVSRSITEAKRCLKKNGKLLLLLPHWSNVQKAKYLLGSSGNRVGHFRG